MKVWTRTITKIKLQTENVNYDFEIPKNENISDLIGTLLMLIHDEDSYPTEEALNIIQRWGYYNKEELFEFIKKLWHFREWGWHETVDDEKTTYEISTGGWSGNEALIKALEHNHWLNWHMTWVQSRRGGHYIFEVKNEDF